MSKNKQNFCTLLHKIKEKIKQNKVFKNKDEILHYIIVIIPFFILYVFFYFIYIFIWIIIFVLFAVLSLTDFLKEQVKEILNFVKK